MATNHLKLRRGKDDYYRTSWVDDEGKRHHRSFGSKRRKAEDAFAAFRNDWNSNPLVRNPDAERPLTFARAWDKFKAHADIYYRRADGTPTGEATNIEYAFRYAIDLFTDEPVADFSPKSLVKCRDRMMEDDLCVNVINGRIRKIRHVFKWLASEELIPAATWHSLQAVPALKAGRTGARTSDPVEAVPDDLVWRTCGHLPPTLRAMVEFQYWTGCRPQEVCNLMAVQIDRSGKVWVYNPPHHKTVHHGKRRTILIGPRAQQVIEPFLSRDLEQPLFSPAQVMRERMAARVAAYQPKEGQADYRLFPSYQRRHGERKVTSRYSDRFTSNAYRHAIGDACAKADLPHWSPNQLRHNAATRIRKEFGLDVAQVILGHSQADTTQVYAEADLKKAIAIMEKVG